MPNVNELLDIVKNEISSLEHGEFFLLRDLFKDYEWNRISRSDRLLLGTLFLNYVNTAEDENTTVEKTSSGQQKYKKSTDKIKAC